MFENVNLGHYFGHHHPRKVKCIEAVERPLVGNGVDMLTAC